MYFSKSETKDENISQKDLRLDSLNSISRMEAIWKIEVEDFPAFILVDDKGNDFFQQIQTSQCARFVK